MADEVVVVPDDIYLLLKLKMTARNAEKQILPEPHWAFCYTMLHKISQSFMLVIQQLGTELRNAVSTSHFLFCLHQDDTSIETNVKVPMLIAFHRHIYDRDWHFSCECVILFCFSFFKIISCQDNKIQYNFNKLLQCVVFLVVSIQSNHI
ncbi:Squalene synthase 1 [Glycine soja]